MARRSTLKAMTTVLVSVVTLHQVFVLVSFLVLPFWHGQPAPAVSRQFTGTVLAIHLATPSRFGPRERRFGSGWRASTVRNTGNPTPPAQSSSRRNWSPQGRHRRRPRGGSVPAPPRTGARRWCRGQRGAREKWPCVALPAWRDRPRTCRRRTFGTCRTRRPMGRPQSRAALALAPRPPAKNKRRVGPPKLSGSGLRRFWGRGCSARFLYYIWTVWDEWWRCKPGGLAHSPDLSGRARPNRTDPGSATIAASAMSGGRSFCRLASEIHSLWKSALTAGNPHTEAAHRLARSRQDGLRVESSQAASHQSPLAAISRHSASIDCP